MVLQSIHRGISCEHISDDDLVSDVCDAHQDARALSAAADHLRRMLQPGFSTAEYSHIEALNEVLSQKYTTKAADAAGREGLNRYIDVVPYDHTRVVLEQRSPDSPCPDYINASFLHNSDENAAVQWKYIVAQAPLPDTCGSFWQMIVEQRVRAVVMLTGIIEGRRRKCEPYFPLLPNETITFGSITVRSLGKREVDSGVLRRRLVISGVSACPHWEIDHFHFTSWPDHGVPESPRSVLALCAALRALPFEKKIRPIVVHCSAGLGRSGVFCVADIAARELAVSGNDVAAACAAVDVSRLVIKLRHQRGGMVQTSEQYTFCYQVLLELVQRALKEIEARSKKSEACIESID